jgi:hypothetical protein
MRAGTGARQGSRNFLPDPTGFSHSGNDHGPAALQKQLHGVSESEWQIAGESSKRLAFRLQNFAAGAQSLERRFQLPS